MARKSKTDKLSALELQFRESQNELQELKEMFRQRGSGVAPPEKQDEKKDDEDEEKPDIRQIGDKGA